MSKLLHDAVLLLVVCSACHHSTTLFMHGYLPESSWNLLARVFIRCTVCRDVAPRIGYLKPALIESRFFPALQVRAPVAPSLYRPHSVAVYTALSSTFAGERALHVHFEGLVCHYHVTVVSSHPNPLETASAALSDLTSVCITWNCLGMQ